jgi:hypothetical protein
MTTKFLRALAMRLWTSRSGVAMTEFALSAPLLFAAGLGGIETANYVLTQMQVSQTAIHIADNVSRAGETSVLENRKIYESDIDDILVGANLQAGNRLDIYEHGRVVISSFEVFDPLVHCDGAGVCAGSGLSDGDQFIHWQRCMGKKNVPSSFGDEEDVLPDGIGPDDARVQAIGRTAVIFVEVRYDYQPLISTFFARGREMRAVASFLVRDSRDLSGIKQRDEDNPDVTAECSAYTDLDVILT